MDFSIFTMLLTSVSISVLEEEINEKKEEAMKLEKSNSNIRREVVGENYWTRGNKAHFKIG